MDDKKTFCEWIKYLAQQKAIKKIKRLKELQDKCK